MILVRTVLGNLKDPVWARHVGEATTDWLELDQWDAHKSRLRARTLGGIELAIALDRGSHLADGDILAWQDAEQRVIATRLRLGEVLVVQLDDLLGQSESLVVQTCIELGHALGNEHWPAVVKANRVYIPLAVDRHVMATVMKTHGFPCLKYEFVAGAEVIRYLAPHEARRLFGGAESLAAHHHEP
jgi:urease accessory protein